MESPLFKTVYLYDEITGEFKGATQAQLSPEGPKGQYLEPVHSTGVTPPSTGVNQVPVFSKGKWSLQSDYRGQSWFDPEGNPVEIQTIGKPTGLTQTVPLDIQLKNTKRDQSAMIDRACSSAITGGFISSALGKPYTYPSKVTDQQNLAVNVLSSLVPSAQKTGWTTPQICATQDPTPVWAYVPHSVAQIQQVGEDRKQFILDNLMKNQALQDQIAKATTISAITAIVW